MSEINEFSSHPMVQKEAEHLTDEQTEDTHSIKYFILNEEPKEYICEKGCVHKYVPKQRHFKDSLPDSPPKSVVPLNKIISFISRTTSPTPSRYTLSDRLTDSVLLQPSNARSKTVYTTVSTLLVDPIPNYMVTKETFAKPLKLDKESYIEYSMKHEESSTNEVFERVIIPHLQPIIRKASSLTATSSTKFEYQPLVKTPSLLYESLPNEKTVPSIPFQTETIQYQNMTEKIIVPSASFQRNVSAGSPSQHQTLLKKLSQSKARDASLITQSVHQKESTNLKYISKTISPPYCHHTLEKQTSPCFQTKGQRKGLPNISTVLKKPVYKSLEKQTSPCSSPTTLKKAAPCRPLDTSIHFEPVRQNSKTNFEPLRQRSVPFYKPYERKPSPTKVFVRKQPQDVIEKERSNTLQPLISKPTREQVIDSGSILLNRPAYQQPSPPPKVLEKKESPTNQREKKYDKNDDVWTRLYPYKTGIDFSKPDSPPADDKPHKPKSSHRKMDWCNYHRLDVIHAFLDDLENTYPSLCTVGVIGQSLEGRALKILKISNGNANNVAVWMDAGIHAREWIAPAVNTYVANHIARNFDKLPSSCTNKDWYFLPVVNPDGYEYSHTKERMWRKNRAWRNGKCVGVDLNRNFSYNWGGKGSSDDPNHHFYRGDHPFSEPESCALRNVLMGAKLPFKVYITLHAFGEVIIFPFAYADDVCPDYVRLLHGATVMSRAIYDTNGNTYKVGISKDMMYRASGTSNDWCFGAVGIPYCYLIELRSKKHKFKLPQEEIEETGVEILNCVIALMDFVDKYPLEKKKA